MTNENTGGVANNLENVDRDIPNLKTRKKKNNITKLILIIGLLVGVIALAGGITLFLKRLEQNKHEEIRINEDNLVKNKFCSVSSLHLVITK